MERFTLDANATTPVLPEVLDAMLPYFTTSAGNPSSAHYSGQRARSAVEQARMAVAKLLHCTGKEIVFTSGGTESNNLALCGIFQPYLDRREPAHLITSQIEHHAITYAAEALERRGREANSVLEVTYLAPNADGFVEPDTFAAALKPHTRLVSLMLANNETGVIQPLGKIARLAKAHNPALLVHTDAVQGAGKLPLDLTGEFKNVDLLSISGHKMYAPLGTGILFVRDGVQLAPLFYGGPHERNRRAGTENLPGIVGLGKAAQLAMAYLNSKPASGISELNIQTAPATDLAALRDRLEQGLLAAIPGTQVNGSTTQRTPNTTNLRFGPLPGQTAGVSGESLLYALDMQGLGVGFGSACQSGANEPSHVLLAMGLTPAEAKASLRLSLSRLTTEAEIDRALEIIPAAVERLRSIGS